MISMARITDQNCMACGACVSACPVTCIAINRTSEGFYMAQIDTDRCVGCGLCQKVCPMNRRPEGRSWEDGEYYAAWATDAVLRRSGSSGGLFGLLSEFVLSQKGIVFGAAYSDDLKFVYHTDSDRIPLEALKKSKYVESNPGIVLRNVKKQLDTGRLVLFCGTSCQIDGLCSYLGKSYPNLITCDFLCHGVPSSAVYEKYISDLETLYGKIAAIDFRSKAFGWKAYCVKAEFLSGKQYLKTRFQDPYLSAFMDSSIIRPECQGCTRLQNSNADITLGDFWGITKIKGMRDTNEGVSLVGIHTEQGRHAFEALLDNNCCEAIFLSKEKYAYAYQLRPISQQSDKNRRPELLRTENMLLMNISLKEKFKGCLYWARAVLQKAQTGKIRTQSKRN